MISLIQKQPAFNFFYLLISKNLKMIFEPVIVKKEFVFQDAKKDKRAARKTLPEKEPLIAHTDPPMFKDELLNTYDKKDKNEAFLKEYVSDLSKMMFITQHKVRQPVTNILGMADLIDQHINSPEALKKIVKYMKQSAQDLDAFTRELTTFISDLEQKGKMKRK